MTESEFQRGFRAGLEAAAELCREGYESQDARAESAADPVLKDRYERRSATWLCAAEMIADIPVPQNEKDPAPI